MSNSERSQSSVGSEKSTEDPFSFGAFVPAHVVDAHAPAHVVGAPAPADVVGAPAPAGVVRAPVVSAPGFIPFSTFPKIYRIDPRQFGEGNFGVVHQATDCQDGKKVAIKKIDSKSLKVTDILREVTCAMSFDSPNLCKVFGFSIDDDGFVYIITEFIDGVELFEYANQEIAKNAPEFVKQIFADIAAGLAYLHGIGFAHRDIKLENIMLELSPAGVFIRSVIIDFGFTMRVSEIPRKSEQGCIFYIAPEIVQHKQLTEKVDIWALGAVLFALIHGYYPVWSEYEDQKLEARDVYTKLLLMKSTPVLPAYSEDNQHLKDLYDICTRCLQYDPSARITAAELVASLPIEDSESKSDE
jgi:serine/threonine protein kinase